MNIQVQEICLQGCLGKECEGEWVSWNKGVPLPHFDILEFCVRSHSENRSLNAMNIDYFQESFQLLPLKSICFHWQWEAWQLWILSHSHCPWHLTAFSGCYMRFYGCACVSGFSRETIKRRWVVCIREGKRENYFEELAHTSV